jgi:predicted aldo/keto reductase-like oxidoreductase
MHAYIRLALQELNGDQRSQLFIQTKTPAKHPEVAKSDIERFRRELGVDRIDSLLMHCMKSGEWPVDMLQIMDVLDEAKEKQRIRAVGVSCHGADPLVASVDCDWIDVHLVRINPFGQKMTEDGEPDEVAAHMKKMRDKGRGVIGMKVFGEDGFDSAEKRLESLKYVLGLGCVQAFTIGFESTQQIDETLDLIEKASA